MNKLLKEINETKHLETKVVDIDAIHRNEITQEVEGQDKKAVPNPKQTFVAESGAEGEGFSTIRGSPGPISEVNLLKHGTSSMTSELNFAKKTSIPIHQEEKKINFKRLKYNETIDEQIDHKYLY